MARLSRLIIPNAPHHVMQRGAARQAVFHDADDFRTFLHYLKDAAKQFKLAIHAYVLMSDHIHLLVSPADLTGLARTMQWIGRHYVPYFNQKYGSIGTIWQGRYKAAVIDSERYFLVCSQYIELNPVRAGVTDQPADYPWSSYRHHVGIAPDPLISEHAVYWALGNTPFAREAAYRHLSDQEMSTEVMAAITDSTLKGWAIGTEEFKSSLEKQANMRVRPSKAGRPRKLSP
ncbi:MAG: transposase [Burkholderiaceae bacterium]